MRAEDFFLLINEIDDALVLEAEGNGAPPEKAPAMAMKSFPFGGIIAAAACFAALVVGILMIARVRMSGTFSPGDSAVPASESSANAVEVTSSESAESSSSTVSRVDVTTEPAMFFYKEPKPEDIVYDTEHNVSYVKNQLLISASLGAPELEIRQLVEELGAKVVGYIEITNDYQIEFLTDKTLDELEAAADYLDSFTFVQGVTLNLVHEINYDVED